MNLPTWIIIILNICLVNSTTRNVNILHGKLTSNLPDYLFPGYITTGHFQYETKKDGVVSVEPKYLTYYLQSGYYDRCNETIELEKSSINLYHGDFEMTMIKHSIDDPVLKIKITDENQTLLDIYYTRVKMDTIENIIKLIAKKPVYGLGEKMEFIIVQIRPEEYLHLKTISSEISNKNAECNDLIGEIQPEEISVSLFDSGRALKNIWKLPMARLMNETISTHDFQIEHDFRTGTWLFTVSHKGKEIDREEFDVTYNHKRISFDVTLNQSKYNEDEIELKMCTFQFIGAVLSGKICADFNDGKASRLKCQDFKETSKSTCTIINMEFPPEQSFSATMFPKKFTADAYLFTADLEQPVKKSAHYYKETSDIILEPSQVNLDRNLPTMLTMHSERQEDTFDFEIYDSLSENYFKIIGTLGGGKKIDIILPPWSPKLIFHYKNTKSDYVYNNITFKSEFANQVWKLWPRSTHKLTHCIGDEYFLEIVSSKSLSQKTFYIGNIYEKDNDFVQEIKIESHAPCSRNHSIGGESNSSFICSSNGEVSCASTHSSFNCLYRKCAYGGDGSNISYCIKNNESLDPIEQSFYHYKIRINLSKVNNTIIYGKIKLAGDEKWKKFIIENIEKCHPEEVDDIAKSTFDCQYIEGYRRLDDIIQNLKLSRIADYADKSQRENRTINLHNVFDITNEFETRYDREQNSYVKYFQNSQKFNQYRLMEERLTQNTKDIAEDFHTDNFVSYEICKKVQDGSLEIVKSKPKEFHLRNIILDFNLPNSASPGMVVRAPLILNLEILRLKYDHAFLKINLVNLNNDNKIVPENVFYCIDIQDAEKKFKFKLFYERPGLHHYKLRLDLFLNHSICNSSDEAHTTSQISKIIPFKSSVIDYSVNVQSLQENTNSSLNCRVDGWSTLKATLDSFIQANNLTTLNSELLNNSDCNLEEFKNYLATLDYLAVYDQERYRASLEDVSVKMKDCFDELRSSLRTRMRLYTAIGYYRRQEIFNLSSIRLTSEDELSTDMETLNYYQSMRQIMKENTYDFGKASNLTMLAKIRNFEIFVKYLNITDKSMLENFNSFVQKTMYGFYREDATFLEILIGLVQIKMSLAIDYSYELYYISEKYLINNLSYLNKLKILESINNLKEIPINKDCTENEEVEHDDNEHMEASHDRHLIYSIYENRNCDRLTIELSTESNIENLLLKFHLPTCFLPDIRSLKNNLKSEKSSNLERRFSYIPSENKIDILGESVKRYKDGIVIKMNLDRICQTETTPRFQFFLNDLLRNGQVIQNTTTFVDGCTKRIEAQSIIDHKSTSYDLRNEVCFKTSTIQIILSNENEENSERSEIIELNNANIIQIHHDVRDQQLPLIRIISEEFIDQMTFESNENLYEFIYATEGEKISCQRIELLYRFIKDYRV